MRGHRDETGPLPDVLEFEGRFMSSRPITNNPLWWHHDQNPVEQQLPDFIPLDHDIGGFQYNSTGHGGWNAERLNTGRSGSSSLETQNGFRDRLMQNERISSANSYAGAGPGSSNYAHPISNSASNANLIRPVKTEHAATASSSAHPPIGLVRTGSLFREENNVGPELAFMTGNSSEKRKFPEGSWDRDDSSERARTTSVSGRSGFQAVPNCHAPDTNFSLSSSAAHVPSLVSSGSLSSGNVPHARSSLFDSPESGSAVRTQNIQQNTQRSPDTSLQVTVPGHSLSDTDIRYNAVVQRPRLVLPPPQTLGEGLNGQNQPVSVAQRPCLVVPPTQAVREGLNVQNYPMPVAQRPRLVLPAPRGIGEGSNVQNHQMPVRYPAQSLQSAQLPRDNNSSSIIPRNSSGSVLATGYIHLDDVGVRNTQTLQLPVIAPTVGSRNLRWNSINRAPSGGVASTSVNAAPSLPSSSIPSGPQPTPGLVSNGNRHRRMEQIRQALLAVDLIAGTFNHPPHEIRLDSGENSQATQAMQQRATLLQNTGPNHSSIGAPNHNSSTNSFETDTRRRLLSRARHMLTVNRGGWDNEATEEGINVRQSLLSALAGVRDRHRDMRLDVDNMTYEELLELGDRIGHVKTGLNEETITKCLKQYMYTSTMKSSQPGAEPCSICQEEYTEGDDLGALECGHEYHTNCIKQWLVLKNSCPICKTAASSSK